MLKLFYMVNYILIKTLNKYISQCFYWRFRVRIAKTTAEFKLCTINKLTTVLTFTQNIIYIFRG